MGLLSVIIPNRNSPFLTKTIEDLLAKSEGEVEIVVHVDENPPERYVDDPRVHYAHPSAPQGLRRGINTAASLAKGEHIMKIDDHCLVGQGYDRILIENHREDNWVQIPRRYALDVENWRIEERGDDKYPIDYMYLDFPRKGKDHDDGMHGVPWKQRRNERKEIEVDDTPSFQGSCYFMRRDYFNDFLHGMNEEGYGQFSQEAQEIGFKTWLGGGAVKVNKKTYYAHLHKGGRYGKMYNIPNWNKYTKGASEWSADYWLNNRWPGRKHDFSWFIDEMFPGMPSWPVNWKEQIKEMGWTN